MQYRSASVRAKIVADLSRKAGSDVYDAATRTTCCLKIRTTRSPFCLPVVVTY
jgi:hypothetical protein